MFLLKSLTSLRIGLYWGGTIVGVETGVTEKIGGKNDEGKENESEGIELDVMGRGDEGVIEPDRKNMGNGLVV